jgi:ribosomal protein S12 methylthiotransferase accessory factor YcaO
MGALAAAAGEFAERRVCGNMFDTLVRRVLSSGAHSETTESPDQTNWLTDNDVLDP